MGVELDWKAISYFAVPVISALLVYVSSRRTRGLEAQAAAEAAMWTASPALIGQLSTRIGEQDRQITEMRGELTKIGVALGECYARDAQKAVEIARLERSLQQAGIPIDRRNDDGTVC